MGIVFESSFDKGFLEVIEADGRLYMRSGFRREALGVNIELPATEVADLTEALLRHVDAATRTSIIESVLKDEKQVATDSRIDEAIQLETSAN